MASNTSRRTATQKSPTSQSGASVFQPAPKRCCASAAVRAMAPHRRRGPGKAPSWFQARLVEGEATPWRGSASSAAVSRSSQPGPTTTPLSSSTTTSASVSRHSRLRQAGAPRAASVADWRI